MNRARFSISRLSGLTSSSSGGFLNAAFQNLSPGSTAAILVSRPPWLWAMTTISCIDGSLADGSRAATASCSAVRSNGAGKEPDCPSRNRRTRTGNGRGCVGRPSGRSASRPSARARRRSVDKDDGDAAGLVRLQCYQPRRRHFIQQGAAGRRIPTARPALRSAYRRAWTCTPPPAEPAGDRSAPLGIGRRISSSCPLTLPLPSWRQGSSMRNRAVTGVLTRGPT